MLSIADEATKPRRRRSAPGRVALSVTAERLFGEFGLDGVSMRQIILAAGQSNNSAIAHHFGSKEDLIDDICLRRAVELDLAQARRLAALPDPEKASVRELLSILFLPVAEIDGGRSLVFTKFLARLMLLPPEDHPLCRQSRKLSSAMTINRLLREKVSGIPTELFHVRYRLVVGMFLAAVIEYHRANREHDDRGAEAQAIVQDVLTIAATAMQAPLTTDEARV
jgi:AcrR family transcriptional regulator